MNPRQLWLFSLGISLALALSAIFVPTTLHTTYAETIPQTDRELIRNGTFDLFGSSGEPTSWAFFGMGSGVMATAGQDGGPAMNLQGINENRPQVFQHIRLPTTTTSVDISGDFRAFISGTPTSAWPVFRFLIATESAELVSLYAQQFTGDTGWLQVKRALTAGEVSAIQSAHSAGEPVFIGFDIQQDGPAVAQAYIDNVSFVVDGELDLPSLDGSVAFAGLDAAGHARTVNRIAPNGSGRSLVWTHPSTVPETNHIYDVVWKPDASEIAFSSNHEIGYSAFNSDVFGISPQGTSLRRITNPPGMDDLAGGAYTYGKVKGSIQNDFGAVTSFMIFIQGAKSPVSVNTGNFGDEVGFPEIEVADLGPESPYVVFIWSKGTDANCHQYPAAVFDVQAGQTTDVGTLSFSSASCGTYNADSLSWKRDGTEIAADVNTPRRFSASGQSFGTDLFSGALLAGEVAWSPTDDRVLYYNQTFDPSTSGIYLTTEGGEAGSKVVGTGNALWVTPAWLPEGDGFVYTVDHEIRQYLFEGKQDTTLAYFYRDFVYDPSVSPDGDFVVFEWQELYNKPDPGGINYNLWVLDRNKPSQMWPLTDDNRSQNPDWSRTNVPAVPSCEALTGVTIQGPAAATTGTQITLTASVQPGDADTPITYAWSPAPTGDANKAQAVYQFTTAGDHQVSVTATNCGGSVDDSHTVTVSTGGGGTSDESLYLPAVVRP